LNSGRRDQLEQEFPPVFVKEYEGIVIPINSD
jgi:hypothetical protein